MIRSDLLTGSTLDRNRRATPRRARETRTGRFVSKHMSMSTIRPVVLSLLGVAWLTMAACRGSETVPADAAAKAAPPPAATPAAPADQPTPNAAMPKPDQPAPAPRSKDPNERTTQTATLAAGCFWCIEAVLQRIDGVIKVESGYTGGDVANPDYEQVCTGTTGHAEAVRVEFDPRVLTYRQLLDWFFQAHDPTTLNRQGNDYGTQYRSAIFWHDDEQRRVAEAAKAAWQDHYQGRVITEITKATTFWRAEDYHQDYFQRNPTQAYCRVMIPPKLKKLGLDQKDARPDATKK
jgi:peptide-methionine (S)-S-oxide reductase